MQGTATMKLNVVGRGATLDEAIARGAIAGPFTVRWATLNGINLGLAATQGATAAGTTRFTEFDGAMAARGDFTVAPDLALAGGVRVELGGQRIQAPISLRIRGNVNSPRFSHS
jgi:hypothetical protein